MGDPRFLGTEQRKRMGAESSHMGMIQDHDVEQNPKEDTHPWGAPKIGTPAWEEMYGRKHQADDNKESK